MERVHAFQDFWNLQVTSKAEAYLENTSDDTEAQMAVINRAEGEVLSAVSNIVGMNITDVDRAGLEYFISSVKLSHLVAENTRKYADLDPAIDTRGHVKWLCRMGEKLEMH